MLAAYNAFHMLVSLTMQTFAQRRRSYLDSLLKTTVRNYPLIKAKHLRSQALEEAFRQSKIQSCYLIDDRDKIF